VTVECSADRVLGSAPVEEHVMLVICAGMPRSASTWSYQVACALLNRQGPTHGLGYMEDAFDEAQAERVRRGGSYVVKIHPPHPLMLTLTASHDARVIYTYRDVRDVIYSFAHKLLSQPSHILERWSGPIMDGFEKWTATDDCVKIRYEDFHRQAVPEIHRIAEALHLRVPREAIAAIDCEFSFEANRSRAERKQRELLQEGHDLRELKHACRHAHDELVHWNHLRSGSIGGWQDVATPRELEQMRHRFGQWLIDNAYETDAGWVERIVAARQAKAAPPRRWFWRRVA
jgi:hypothetical protein